MKGVRTHSQMNAGWLPISKPLWMCVTAQLFGFAFPAWLTALLHFGRNLPLELVTQMLNDLAGLVVKSR
jgi:hypothetical protein